ncbi:Hpt domain protein [compost metagenome]
MTNEFVVTAPAQIKYLQRRLAEMELLLASLSRGEFEPTKTLGHQIKGNARSFDFDTLEDLGIRLELAAKNQNAESAVKILGEMKMEVLRLLGTLSRAT